MENKVTFTLDEISNFLKLSVLVVGIVVGVITFFTPRSTHNLLAGEVKEIKLEQKQKEEAQAKKDKKMLGLLCQIGVTVNGKKAVVEYCTNL